MASTNKTAFLSLNQWLLSDKPQVEDFNIDNLLLDSHLSAAKQEAEALRAQLATANTALAAVNTELEELRAELKERPSSEPQRPEQLPILFNHGFIAQENYACHYWKNNFGEVHVVFGVKTADGSGVKSGNVARLPEGFRPAEIIPDIALRSASERSTGSLSISPDGSIWVFGSSDTTTVYVNVTFLAAQ